MKGAYKDKDVRLKKMCKSKIETKKVRDERGNEQKLGKKGIS